HLRQPEGGSLSRVQGHEAGANHDARQACDNRPSQREPERGADKPDRDREVLEVAKEPQRRLMPYLAVPFRIRHPVDRALLDATDAGPLSAYGCGLALSGHGKLISLRSYSSPADIPRCCLPVLLATVGEIVPQVNSVAQRMAQSPGLNASHW